MKENFKLTVTLKQQTPLIHFQHNQQGATLRASEVKPKLDRFLIEKFNKEKINCSDWLIGEDKIALDYKMRIIANGEVKKSGVPDIYYGNMGTSEPVECVIGDCDLTIICFHPELLKYIDNNLDCFFVSNNFGRMQGKGFGGYIVNRNLLTDFRIAQYIKSSYDIDNVYKISGYPRDAAMPSFNGKKYVSSIFDDIKTLYSVMKSGLNIGDYKRSYLFEYCHEVLNLGNEKALLKKEKVSPCDEYGVPVKNPNNNRSFAEQSDEAYRYVRSMLGVGDHIDYITGFFNYNGKYKPERKKLSVKISNDDIERYCSPINFKIINNAVYVFAKQPEDEIFSKTFKFKGNKTIEIMTPSKDEFDIQDFLNWFMKRYKADCEKNTSKRYNLKNKKFELIGGSI